MSDEYTPTSGRVRRCYAQERIREGAPPPESRAEFDRWLAEHDRAKDAEIARMAAEIERLQRESDM